MHAYVLGWQEERRVQVHRRTADKWTVSDYGPEEQVELSGMIELAVRKLYPEPS